VNLSWGIRVIVVQLAIPAQEGVHWVSVFAVDVDFGEQGEIAAVYILYELFDLLLRMRLLVHKVAARESEYLQTLVF